MGEITTTVINQSPTISLVAGEKMEGAQAIAVKVSSGNVVKATAGANAIGLVIPENGETINAGDRVDIQVKDIGMWKVGGVIEVGDELTSDANGLAVKATTGDFITAIALTSAAAANAFIRVQIVKSGYKA